MGGKTMPERPAAAEYCVIVTMGIRNVGGFHVYGYETHGKRSLVRKFERRGR